MGKEGQPYTVHARELLMLAAAEGPGDGDDCARSARTARGLARRICMLLAADYACLPYQPPEVCADLFSAA